MRLEVLAVNSGDIQVYPLNRQKIIIGSGDVCDIIVPVEGVSRKHLIVTIENDQFFVADQGSTNGTFINEERLQPGKRVEFTSFFPVRLGEHILLTLLSDDESNGLEFSEFNAKKEATSPSISTPKTTSRSESTGTFSLKDMKQAKTQDLVKKRKEIQRTRTKPGAKKAPKDEDSSRMLLVKIGIVCMIGLAVYYQFFIKETVVENTDVAKVGTQVVVDPSTLPKTSYLPPEQDKISYENLLTAIKDLRCVNDIEKYLCENVKGAKDSPWGVAQVKLMMNIMVDGTIYFEDAKKHVELPKVTSEENIQKYLNDTKQTAIASFIVYAIPDNLNFDMLKDYTITIALFNQQGDKIEIAAVMTAEGLKKAKESLSTNTFENIRGQGMKALDFTHDYYRVY